MGGGNVVEVGSKADWDAQLKQAGDKAVGPLRKYARLHERLSPRQASRCDPGYRSYPFCTAAGRDVQRSSAITAVLARGDPQPVQVIAAARAPVRAPAPPSRQLEPRRQGAPVMMRCTA